MSMSTASNLPLADAGALGLGQSPLSNMGTSPTATTAVTANSPHSASVYSADEYVSPTALVATSGVNGSGNGLISAEDGMVHPSVMLAQTKLGHSTRKSHSRLADEGMQQGQREFLNLQMLQRSLWTDLPDLYITFEDLAYTHQVPTDDVAVSTLWTALVNAFMCKTLVRKHVAFPALQPITGFVRPRELTLVLGAPGHGKSTLLQALAGRFHNDSRLSGQVRYNNLTYQEALKKGFYVKRMTCFVNQGEAHNALLTVRETFQFALDNTVADPALLESAEYLEKSKQKVDFMLDLLGLREAEHTILGNAMVRGVSGGQKRRVSIGEMMMCDARALFLDEITTGLDSSASYGLLHALKSWAYMMNGSAVAALLQPTPECFDLFDRLILLRNGAIIYDGPISDVRAYFLSLGVPIPDDMDLADWLSDFITEPTMVYNRTLCRAAHKAGHVSGSYSQTLKVSGQEVTNLIPTEDILIKIASDPTVASETQPEYLERLGLSGSKLSDQNALDALKLAETISPILTTPGLENAFVKSNQYRDNLAVIATCSSIENHASAAQFSAYSRAQFGLPYAHSWWRHMQLNVSRSYKNMKRNSSLYKPRVFRSIFLGLILGGLFYQIPAENYEARISLIAFLLLTLSFANIAEIPFAAEGKNVVSKQAEAGFFPVSSYVLSVIIMQIPLSLAESGIFSFCVYFMTGFVYDAGRFFFFWLVLFLVTSYISVLFRAIAWGTPRDDVASQLSAPIVALFFVCCGFMLIYNSFPRWMLGLYWFSPFSWALRSLGINEFYGSRYNYPSVIAAFSGMTQGEAELRSWGIDPTWAYKWSGVGYLIGLIILFSFLSWFVLGSVRYPLNIGTRRFTDERDEAERADDTAGMQSAHMEKVSPQLDTGASDNVLTTPPVGQLKSTLLSAQHFASSFWMTSASSTMPFVRVSLSWHNIRYTVQIRNAAGETVPRKLLSGIDGYSKAGTLTALMGSSGAGKTVLMDVIAGRKTVGVIEGEIFVNGFPKKTETFNRLCGYVEQADNHTSTQTVREALSFSARLRLPCEVPADTREKFVDEILDILELTPIANRIVGDAFTPGLSPGQLKLVTIGVELASNPSVLFLDEPTSGLDSRAALVVMRVIKRISLTGRSVLCTIHQPAAALFCMFDRLLLLTSGGQVVYFGDVGLDGATIVEYFENASVHAGSIRRKKNSTTNVASWMLEIINCDTSVDAEAVDYVELYKCYKMQEQNNEALVTMLKPEPGFPELKFESVYAAPYSRQLYELLHRTFASYWRNPSVIWVRQGLMVFLAVLFGCMYFQEGESDLSSLTSKYEALFVGAIFPGWTIMSMTILTVSRRRTVFYREQASFMYSPSVWAISLSIVEIFYSFFSAIFFSALFYPMIGYKNTAEAFFRFLFFEWIFYYVWISLGQVCAALLPNVMVANIVGSLLSSFMLLFDGGFKLKSQMGGWEFIWYINPVPKAIIAMVSTVFDCGDSCTHLTNVVGPDGTYYPSITSFQYVLDYINYRPSYSMWVGYTFLTIFVLQAWFFLAVWKVNYQKR